ncbi:hypothetical protein [Persicirhabdus sediminis]|uniref:Uncharacterized protein n=1 Tax=Persicirhabdus sediminis TaxID=454144 RepID=A0A8J7MGQ4_9BACT|nr:hypothetical protein [Persicirhabdus sediminis]MBK1792587.1 hypothetical protein [Persicirhabdus sediminis]
MIEVYLLKLSATEWQLTATIFPMGGHGGLAQEAALAQLCEPTFTAGLAAMKDDGLAGFGRDSFIANDSRWPVTEPKFQIVNDGSHPDPAEFGHYRVQLANKEILGRLENRKRSDLAGLIIAATEVYLANRPD